MNKRLENNYSKELIIYTSVFEKLYLLLKKSQVSRCSEIEYWKSSYRMTLTAWFSKIELGQTRAYQPNLVSSTV